VSVYYGKCGCGWIKTDYPFMSCIKCGYLGCGTKEDIEQARKTNTLIEWQKEKPINVEINDYRLPDSNLERSEEP